MSGMRQRYECGIGMSTAAQILLGHCADPAGGAPDRAERLSLLAQQAAQHLRAPVCCRFVEQSHPGMGSGFELKTQYPSTTLTDPKQTLQDAQLENALIIQS